MKIHPMQFDAITADLRQVKADLRDSKAALKAIEAQNVEILKALAETNTRISFARRPSV